MQKKKKILFIFPFLFLVISAVQVPLGFPPLPSNETPSFTIFDEKKLFLGDENKVIGLADNYKLAARKI